MVLLINRILSFIGIRVVKNSTFMTFQKLAAQSGNKELEFLKAMPRHLAEHVLANLPKSHAQLRQDVFALAMLNFKRSGFFVEFGATNGKDRSNTLLLEKDFGWSGILAEPAKSWHKELLENRSCYISKMCVWVESGLEIQFSENSYRELSTISEFANRDSRASNPPSSASYSVPTISLLDLLMQNNAPRIIDFLSIDTEGSEYEILKAFDFSKYRFRTIVCEHNYGPMREKIINLLVSNGYSHVYENISEFDDWYVLDES
jgi:FkbM family methyltransferase